MMSEPLPLPPRVQRSSVWTLPRVRSSRARRFSLAGNETYQWADLFDLPIGLTNRFDWVFEHTCFCALEPARRVDYVRAITRALKPEGALLAIFFLNPWDPGEMPEEGGPPFEVTREELDLLFGTHFELVEELKPRRAYPEREGREIIRLLRRSASVSVRKESLTALPTSALVLCSWLCQLHERRTN